jgi:N-acetylglucosaminyldiphosphoundecaprenol N-acetyl-beta-D-mannosaminyltransferase
VESNRSYTALCGNKGRNLDFHTARQHESGVRGNSEPKLAGRAVSILGVEVANCSRLEAIGLLENLFRADDVASHGIFIVNAHTLNLAAEDERYRCVLNAAHTVFADGTGARWAARLRGVRLKDNLVGTDLIPQLFRATAGFGYRYFLLGARAETITRAAEVCRNAYPGWTLAGFHSGHFRKEETRDVIEKINSAKPHLLLVGMGNPLQELWIHENQRALRVPVCIGVGGLFDHWGGNLARAPAWVRRRGFEWLHILSQQPHKWRRYLLGNPKFLFRILRTMTRESSIR